MFRHLGQEGISSKSEETYLNMDNAQRLQRACCAIIEAYAVVISHGLAEKEDVEESTARNVAIFEACAQRDRALCIVRESPAQSRVTIQAKIQVLLVLKDWLTLEDWRVAELAFAITQDVSIVLENNSLQAFYPAPDNMDALQHRSQWLSRFPLFTRARNSKA